MKERTAGSLRARLPNIRYRLCLTLQNLGEGLWGDGDRTAHEFGDVVATQELPMIVGIGGGKFERLSTTAVGAYMCEEGAGERPVVATAAEHYPSAITRPRVIALSVVGVHFVEPTHSTALQVHQPEVGIVVPDVEIAVAG